MSGSEGGSGGRTVWYVVFAWVFTVAALGVSISVLPQHAKRGASVTIDHEHTLSLMDAMGGPSNHDQSSSNFSTQLKNIDSDGAFPTEEGNGLKPAQFSSSRTTQPVTSLAKRLLTEHTSSTGSDVEAIKNDPGRPMLVIVIGVAPGYFARRKALRETWLSWCIETLDCTHVFFTEHPSNGSRGYRPGISDDLEAEANEYKDLVFQEGESGYGKENGRRELFHIQWVLANIPGFKYYLRVDDDGFLCLRQLLEELHYHHDSSRPLLHGKYHCHAAKARMDENYLLLSHQLCAVLARGFGLGFLPFAPKLTFALNLGNVVPILAEQGLKVFDDQQRICWPYGRKASTNPCHQAWRGQLKTRPGPFCDNFIWSHWVKEPTDLRMIFALQTNDSTTDTMRSRQSEEEKRANTSRVVAFTERLATPVCYRWPGFKDDGTIPVYKTPETVVGKNWGIPGMTNLDNNTKLREELTQNVSGLLSACRDRKSCWTQIGSS